VSAILRKNRRDGACTAKSLITAFRRIFGGIVATDGRRIRCPAGLGGRSRARVVDPQVGRVKSSVRRCLWRAFPLSGAPAIRPEGPHVRTFTPKAADITREWHVIDADGAILGRLATEVATLLRGKHKPIWAPHLDTGDHVVIVNASKLAVSPRKLVQKTYHRHSGYPGGIRSESLEHLLARDPEKVVKLAVRRMLPKGPLGRQMLRKLKVYGGPTHPHQAQRPVARPLPERSKARTA
jgi:large subunit ribosomal protein L13